MSVSALKRAKELEPRLVEEGTPVALLSTFHTAFLRPYLIDAAFEMGWLVRPWHAPMGQLEQEILDDSSELYQSNAKAVILLLRLEDLDAAFGHAFESLDVDSRQERVESIKGRLRSLVQTLRDRTSATILVSNFHPSQGRLLDPFEAGQANGPAAVVSSLNVDLAAALADVPGAFVFDHVQAVNRIGLDAFFDEKLFAMARVAISSTAQPAYARALARTLYGVLLPRHKCLVLDLDNTLWGGVLGDDGLAGIKIGDEGQGLLFRRFQLALRSLKARGLMLAIASKNYPDAVAECFRAHPDLVLRESDFVAIEAGWQPKSEMLRRIAASLNIGLNSLVFIDDNPVERAEVRANVPEVRVLDLPTHPGGYVAALSDLEGVFAPSVSEEDRTRSEMMLADRKRQEAVSDATNLQDFLRSLEMTLECGDLDAGTFARVHQLCQKTNQYNLTTIRYTEDELRRMMDDPAIAIRWYRLEDRYGKLGIVGVGVVKSEQDGAVIETFLMSCRVMNRGVEDAMLADLMSQLAPYVGTVQAEYRPTAKNAMVRDFFPRRGFEPTAAGTQDGERFVIARERAPTWPEHIKRITGGGA